MTTKALQLTREPTLEQLSRNQNASTSSSVPPVVCPKGLSVTCSKGTGDQEGGRRCVQV